MSPSPKSTGRIEAAAEVFSDDRHERSTQERIEIQIELLSRMVPGTREHRLATRVLLAYQDSLHILIETRKVVEALRTEGPLTLDDTSSWRTRR